MPEIRDMTDADLLSALKTAKQESTQARFDRIHQNRMNFDMYNLRQDWGYKIKGQSREFLPKVAMATEQNANFIQQGLVDVGEWFNVDCKPGLVADQMRIKPFEVQRLLQWHLEENNIIPFVGDSMKVGLLGSLMICKIRGEEKIKPQYKTKMAWKGMSLKKRLVKVDKKAWELDLELVRQEDFYPDPTGRNMYVIQDIFLDFYQIEQMSKGDYAIYRPEVVDMLRGTFSQAGYDKEFYKNKETGQNTTFHGRRHQIKLTEYWGNVIDSEGNLIYENVVFTVANDTYVIQRPTDNPYWHQKPPYIAAPIIRVPHGVWGKALMDAPSYLNKAINELFNLGLDGGLMAVHGIKEIREHWLEDPSQVENGIAPGDTLRVNAQAPPGASVLTNTNTSSIPPEFMNMYNMVNQEHYTASLTNDLRMGVANFRSVKATEVVEASQSITSMFTGMAKQIEVEYLTKVLEMSWQCIAQHIDDMDEEVLVSLFGRQRADELRKMSGAEIFAESVQGCKFSVFGISATMDQMKDFTHLQGLLQTLASSPVLMEAFVQSGNDFGQLLQQIMKALNIDASKLKKPASTPSTPQEQSPDQGPQGAPQGMPNAQSQIPQSGSANNAPSESPIPSTQFPASKATPAGQTNLPT